MSAIALVGTIASVIKTAVDLTPDVIKTVQDATPFAQVIYNAVVKGDSITQEDLDKLEAQITDLSNQLQLPLPDETPSAD